MAELPEWDLGQLWTLDRHWLWFLKIKTHAEGKFPMDPDDAQLLFYVLRGKCKIPQKEMRFQATLQTMPE